MIAGSQIENADAFCLGWLAECATCHISMIYLLIDYVYVMWTAHQTDFMAMGPVPVLLLAYLSNFDLPS